MPCRILVGLDARDNSLLFRTTDGRWSPLRHDAATVPAARAEAMADAIEAVEPSVAAVLCLDADCVAGRMMSEEDAGPSAAAFRVIDGPAFAVAGAWA